MNHIGDKALQGVLDALGRLYAAPQGRTEERLRTFLQPKIQALQRRKDETATAYRTRLLLAFTGSRWATVRRKIAEDFTDVHEDVVERVNNSLEQAFADGMNDASYTLAQSGVETWPITASIVAGLVAAGLILLNKREVQKGDTKYNEERTQSAVHGAIARNVSVEDMAKDISAHIANARRNEMEAYARASIYGASDYGAYMAGLEAQQVGVEVEKTWLSIMDLRVRDSHRGLHGDTLPMREKFQGLHGELRYPHDPTAPPAEIYRCRCRMVVHLAGRSPGTYSEFLMPWEVSGYQKWRDRQIRKAGSEVELAKIHKRLMRR